MSYYLVSNIKKKVKLTLVLLSYLKDDSESSYAQTCGEATHAEVIAEYSMNGDLKHNC